MASTTRQRAITKELRAKLRVTHDTCQAAGQLAGQAVLELLGSAAEEHGDAELAARRYKEPLFIYLAVGSARGLAVMD